MAGEWIKVRTNLWNDPRISQLCDITSSQEATIVGGLYWLWATADEHTETGLMPGLSIGAIDRKTGIAGFGEALVSIGWVQDGPNGITLARFDEHNGTSAKTRAQTARRVANHKNNAPVTLNTEIANAATVSLALPREEKRREEVEEKKEQHEQQPLSDAVPASPPEKRVRKSAEAAKAQPGTGKVWAAYALAYWNRYGVEPVRNAMVNGQLSNLVRRIGLEDAEQVASFFVGHQHRYYVEKMHSVGLLLSDCEKLRTEWATRTQMTSAKAVQQDRTQTNFDAWAPLIAEARAREAANGK